MLSPLTRADNMPQEGYAGQSATFGTGVKEIGSLSLLILLAKSVSQACVRWQIRFQARAERKSRVFQTSPAVSLLVRWMKWSGGRHGTRAEFSVAKPGYVKTRS